MSRDQFQKVTIKGSFINADDFESPKELAEYLNYLTTNETAYLEYFDWKFNFLFKQFEKTLNSSSSSFLSPPSNNNIYSMFCFICTQLHNETYLQNDRNRQWKLSEWFNHKLQCWDKGIKMNWLKYTLKYLGICLN
jgi:hypothetical protein